MHVQQWSTHCILLGVGWNWKTNENYFFQIKKKNPFHFSLGRHPGCLEISLEPCRLWSWYKSEERNRTRWVEKSAFGMCLCNWDSLLACPFPVSPNHTETAHNCHLFHLAWAGGVSWVVVELVWNSWSFQPLAPSQAQLLYHSNLAYSSRLQDPLMALGQLWYTIHLNFYFFNFK